MQSHPGRAFYNVHENKVRPELAGVMDGADRFGLHLDHEIPRSLEQMPQQLTDRSLIVNAEDPGF